MPEISPAHERPHAAPAALLDAELRGLDARCALSLQRAKLASETHNQAANNVAMDEARRYADRRRECAAFDQLCHMAGKDPELARLLGDPRDGMRQGWEPERLATVEARAPGFLAEAFLCDAADVRLGGGRALRAGHEARVMGAGTLNALALPAHAVLGPASPRFVRVKSNDGLEQVGILTPTGYLSPDDIPVELRPGDLVAATDDKTYNEARFARGPEHLPERRKILALSKDLQRRYGIPWQVTFGQALLESGGGLSRAARERNNFLGLKLRTHKGKYLLQKFDNPEACFEKYARVLTQINAHVYGPAFHYAPAIDPKPGYYPEGYDARRASPKKFLEAIAPSYCPEPGYVAKVEETLQTVGVALA